MSGSIIPRLDSGVLCPVETAPSKGCAKAWPPYYLYLYAPPSEFEFVVEPLVLPCQVAGVEPTTKNPFRVLSRGFLAGGLGCNVSLTV